jgi:hypothetical protein
MYFLELGLYFLKTILHIFEIPSELGGTIVETYCRNTTIDSKLVISYK